LGTNIVATGSQGSSSDDTNKAIAQRIAMKLSQKQGNDWLCYVSYNLPKPNEQQQQSIDMDMTPNLQLFAEKHIGQYLKTINLM